MKWLLLVLFASCSQVQMIEKPINEDRGPAKNLETKVKELPRFEVMNGKVKFIKFPIQKEDGVYTIQCKEEAAEKPLMQDVPMKVQRGHAYFYYAESYFSKAKQHFCFFEEKKILEIVVKQFPYKQEFLNVAQSKVTPSKKNKERAAREWHMMQKVYKNSHNDLYISEEFIKPLNSYITSVYGNQRVFNNQKRSQHLGNDFRARVGVPIPTSNRGKVVYTGHLFYAGKTVVVDHGMKIFTLYAHLSKIKVKTGDMVEKGEIVGLSGRTGRVSGPHLHWGVKMYGHNIDGFSLVEQSKMHFMKHELVK